MNSEHSCGPDCQECRKAGELKPGQFETIVASFGVPYGAVLIRRATAEKLAQAMVGEIIDNKTDLATPFLRGAGINSCIVDLSKDRYRIISTRLEDDTPDGTKGRVIAICEPVEQHNQPYRPNMEYK